MTRRPAALLLAGSLTVIGPSLAGAQRDSLAGAAEVSAPISDVVYTVAFDRTSARARTLRVTMDFRVGGDGPVLLSLPAWTPGAYELSFFSRWVTGFAATVDDRPARWEKSDHDTWRIHRGRSRSVRVSFDYRADSLDNAMAWSAPDFAFFNGTNLFLYPEGRPLDFPAMVRIRTEPEWLVATGMTPGTEPRSYTASDYHELVDMPFFVGAFELDSAQIEERWVRFATYPVGSVSRTDRASIWHHFRRMVPPQRGVFGDIPWETYTVLQVNDTLYGGISALEHRNSHLMITTPLAFGSVVFASIHSHEFFHAWNVKRLRPADLWPYRYDRAQPTTLLWMAEGVTDYYADVALVRGGIVDSATFLRLTTDKMQEVNAAPAVALEDASLSTWVNPVDGTATIYYPKGALAGLLIDILIRDASDNRASLDHVMRQLYRETYAKGSGFTNEQFWTAVRSAARGRSFQEFEARYIDGRDPFPWTTVLPLAGLRLVVDTLREPRLGITTVLDSIGVLVVEVEPGSSSGVAGVQPGDYLVSIGSLAITDENFGIRFRSQFGGRDGAPLPIVVRRGDRTLTLPGTLRHTIRLRSQIAVDARAGAKAARIRSGIFRGTTDG